MLSSRTDQDILEGEDRHSNAIRAAVEAVEEQRAGVAQARRILDAALPLQLPQEESEGGRRMVAEAEAELAFNEIFVKQLQEQVERYFKEREAEQRAAEQRAAEEKEREAEQRAAEQRAAEEKEQRAAEQRAAEQRAAEQRAAEQRAAEQRAAEQRAAEQRAAEERAKERRAELFRQLVLRSRTYSLVVLKAWTGLLKFVCEDVIHFFVQLVFAIKLWDELTDEMKAFTFGSVSAGLLVSIAGPVKELCKLPGLHRRAGDVGVELRLDTPRRNQPVFDQEPGAPLRMHQGIAEENAVLLPAESGGIDAGSSSQARSNPDGVEGHVAARSSGPLLSVEPGASQAGMAAVPQEPLLAAQTVTIKDISVLDFLADSSLRHSKEAHCTLLASAIVYWTGMAAMPLLFASSIRGGANASVPMSAVLYFGVIIQATTFVELWIANHTSRGYVLLRDFRETLLGGFRNTSTAECLFSVVLGLIARYDTFADVVFTIVVMKTDPITELKFTHTLGWTVPLPCPLHWVALVTLVGGVFIAQGVLGVCLLATKTHMAAALKLNEFCFLLSLSELDSVAEAAGVPETERDEEVSLSASQ